MKEMYVALSGAVAQEQHLAILANNLANVNSTGFKRDVAIFEVLPPQARLEMMDQSVSRELDLPPSRQAMLGANNYARIARTDVDFSPGECRPTNNPLDISLQESDSKKGVAFFVVETPQGDRLTRMGNFLINDKQELVTPDGFRVKSSDGGPIKLTGSLAEVSRKGEIAVKGQPAGSLKVSFVEHPEDLEKIGNGLFSDRNGAVKTRDMTDSDGARVRQGYLEMSNVNVVAEMVKMIETQRTFNTFQKSIQGIDDIAGRVINMALGS